jgi:effector-binding domain-containing protein
MSDAAVAEPAVVARPEQATVGIREEVTMATIARVADRIVDVAAWLGAHRVPPSGPPYLRYRGIDMAGRLDVEAGFRVATPVAGDGEVVAGMLPAGRYVVTTHRGHPDGLAAATAALLGWAEQRGLAWDTQETPDGTVWACRLEIYRTDPRVQPDMAEWDTDLVFKLAE